MRRIRKKHSTEPVRERTLLERMGFQPDATQRRLLETESKQVILNCCRQWGKSTVTAVRAVMQAMEEPGSLTLAVSPSGRQSGEFVRKAEVLARNLEIPIKKDGENRLSMAFPNGSRIIGLPETEERTRGFSAVNLLVVDEAARVNEGLYLALRPTVAVSEGKIWLMSTPFGKRGFFYDTWMNGDEEWERVQVTATEFDRIPPAVLARERKNLDPEWFRQEYFCEFTDAETGVFRRDVIERAIRKDIRPLNLEKRKDK